MAEPGELWWRTLPASLVVSYLCLVEVLKRRLMPRF
jgi:hypothetical protein